MKRVIALLSLVVLPAMIFAQTANGKIAGVVTSTDGEVLSGANVIVIGTSYGSAADADGRYYISDVPAGKYTIQFQYIGYATTDVSNVIVSSGLTRSLDQALQIETIAGQRVTVVAERPLIQNDKTSSINVITADDLENMPIRNVNAQLATVPGVVVQDNEIYIRGGRENEVAYFINGTPVTCLSSRNSMIGIPQEAVEEMQVQVGGYDASVGGANSGIVTRKINRGTNEWHGSLTLQSDGTGIGDEWFGTKSLGHRLLVGSVSGPLIKDKIKFYANIEANFRDDPFHLVGEPFEFLDRADQETANVAFADTIDLVWPGYRETNDSYIRFTGSITQDFAPVINNLSVIYSTRDAYMLGGTDDIRSSVDGGLRGMLRHNDATIRTSTIETTDGDTSYTVTIPARRAYDERTRLLITDELSYNLSANTILKLNAGYLSVKTENKDDWFGNDWEKWYDGDAVQDYIGISEDVWTPFKSRYSQKTHYKLNGIPFGRPGTAPDRYYYKTDTEQFSTNGSFSTVQNNHTITAGFNYRKYTTREIGVDPIMAIFSLPEEEGLDLYQIVTYGSVDAIPIDTRRIYMDGFGFDYDFNETDDRTLYGAGEDVTYIDGPKRPSELGFYLQDKFEFNDIIINAGVRLDVFDPDEETLLYPDSIRLFLDSEYIRLDEWKKVEPYAYIQPRIGISFPVSDIAKIYGYYGKFAQMPDLAATWHTAYDYRTQIGRGGNYYSNNSVGYGIEPSTTTQYEVGFAQQLGNNMAIDITGFYKNQKGLVTVERVSGAKLQGASVYNRQVNGDFSTVKGVEFKYTLRRTNRLALDMNYTFSSAEATGGDAWSYISAVDRGSDTPKMVMPVNFNQPHVGSVKLDYRYVDNDGGPILENLGVNLLFNFSSGHSWTAVYRPGALGQSEYFDVGVDYMNDTRSRKALEPIGASQTPWTFNTDLRIDKRIPLGFANVTVFARVTNLFDRRNVLNVYQVTGSADDDGWLTQPGIADDAIILVGGDVNENGIDDYIELYNAINIDNDEAWNTQIGGRLISAPRQIFVGLTLNF